MHSGLSAGSLAHVTLHTATQENSLLFFKQATNLGDQRENQLHGGHTLAARCLQCCISAEDTAAWMVVSSLRGVLLSVQQQDLSKENSLPFTPAKVEYIEKKSFPNI